MEKEKKQAVMTKYRRSEKDVGSTEVQVALLTERITELTNHLTANPHDYHSQRGLMKLVGHRRKLLTYLSREDVTRYHKLLSQLGLRK